jgi:AraC-like DNA-binding protein
MTARRPARHEPTVAVQVLQALLMRAAQAGQSPAAVMARFGLSPAPLQDPDGRVPASIVRALWEELPTSCGDPNFGLTLAAGAPDAALGVVAYVAQHAPTLGRGFSAAVTYARLLQDVAACFIEPGDAGGSLRFVQAPLPRGPVPPRHAVEFGFARAILMARRSTGVDVAPVHVRFAFARPSDTSAHERLFRAPLTFDHARNELEFDEATLGLPQRDADSWLRAVVEDHARAALERLAPRSALARDVVTALGACVQRGDADLSSVARALSLTERTLQRRLADEGLRFRALADDVRRALATRYLVDRTHSLAQIALLLGFSEQAAFQRAFVRWTGMTPGQFRCGDAPSVA